MKEPPHIRLQALRKKRGFVSAAAAARAFGWTESTYRAHENGTRDISRKAARQYAAVYGCSVDELLYGNKTDTDYEKTVKRALAIRTLPRLNWTMADGQSVEEKIEEATSFSSVPGELNVGQNAFTLDNQDDSMADTDGRSGETFREGSLLIFDPDLTPEPGDFVLAEVANSPTWVFRQYRVVGYDDGHPIIHLTPFNPAYPIYKITKGRPGRVLAVLAARLDAFKQHR
jgi:SOS-response transcriptional repressor LexA